MNETSLTRIRWNWISSPMMLRAVVFALLILYVVLSLAGVIVKDNRLTTTEIVLIAVALVFASGLVERLGEISIGKEGVKAGFEKVEKRLSLQEAHLQALHFVLKHALSKFELDKLRGLENRSFVVRFHPQMHQELHRLDAAGLIAPLLSGGLEEIKMKYGNEQRLFDLKTCVAITPEGKEYLRLYDEVLQEKPGVES